MNKKTIIEAVGFILMVVSIITLLCVAYEVNKVSKDIKKKRWFIDFISKVTIE